MSTANLKEKTLKFTKTFRGFNLLVQVTVVPATNDPRSQYDYNIVHTQVFTTHEHIDVHLLLNAWERIAHDIEVHVLENIHSMYMNALKEDMYKNKVLTSTRPDYEDQRLQDIERTERLLNDHFEKEIY